MAEGFWAGASVKNENINPCDPGRLCNDERETFMVRCKGIKFCKKACYNGDYSKVVDKTSEWFQNAMIYRCSMQKEHSQSGQAC